MRHLILLLLVTGLASVPRTAAAQTELAGSWSPRNTEDISNDGLPVDYTGLPLTDEGRLRALTYSESQLSMIERQCEGWPAFYLVQGPFGLKIWQEIEPARGTTVSWTIGAWEDRAPMVIWMDGRAHPSEYAAHTRGGFSTGRWEGDTLVVRTTHMKAGVLRKNGPPISDRATLTTRFLRHGNILTVVVVVEDPYYLAEPYVLSKSFSADGTPVPPVGPPCISTFEGRDVDAGVPHYVPEENPFRDELSERLNIPREAVLGYPETIYPEYRKKIQDSYRRPDPCKNNCGPPVP